MVLGPKDIQPNLEMRLKLAERRIDDAIRYGSEMTNSIPCVGLGITQNEFEEQLAQKYVQAGWTHVTWEQGATKVEDFIRLGTWKLIKEDTLEQWYDPHTNPIGP